MSWIKRVTYRPKGHTGPSLYKDFPVKASRNSSGLNIREEDHGAFKQVEGYTGSSYRQVAQCADAQNKEK